MLGYYYYEGVKIMNWQVGDKVRVIDQNITGTIKWTDGSWFTIEDDDSEWEYPENLLEFREWELERINMTEYEQQDYDTANTVIGLGFLLDSNKQTIQTTEKNIIEVAKSYYTIRMRTYDPKTGGHL